MKKILLNVFRVGISLGLLIYLIYLADLPKILHIIRSIDPYAIVFSLGVFTLAMLILSMRWHSLTASYGISTAVSKLFIFYHIGLFFNNFLPTSIGGDLGRAYYLAQDSGQRSASIGTVFLERVMGLLSTLSLAFVSLLWLMDYFKTNKIIYITTFLAFIVALFLATVMSRRIYRQINKLISLITFYDIGDKINRVFDTLHYYRDKKFVLFKNFIYSLLAQIMLIFMNYILAHGLGLREVTLGYLFLVVPVTFIIGMLPSINGIGVRDTGYVLLLSRQGLETSQILSLSFTVTIIPIMISLLGGLFFFFYRHKGIRAPDLKEGNFE